MHKYMQQKQFEQRWMLIVCVCRTLSVHARPAFDLLPRARWNVSTEDDSIKMHLALE